jgi:hypothetical protein
MLEGLDDIPWAEMEHAYGVADKVPEWIRALASHDEKTRQSALWELDSTIYHQGGIYKPTVYAIPFFLELLNHPHIEGKAELLEFLADIGRGGRFGTPQHLLSWAYSPEWLDEWEQKEVLDHTPGADTHAQEVLWQGYDTYLRFLDHEDQDIRKTVLDLLGSFRRESATIVSLFLERLQTENDLVLRATLVWMLYGVLPRKHMETKTHLRPYLSASEPILVRFVTALAFAEMDRELLSEEIFDILCDIFQNPEIVEAEFKQVPQSGWGIPATVSGLFPYIGRERTQNLLPILWTHLQTRTNVATAPYITRSALFLAFDAPPPPPRSQLNHEQLRTLQIIAEELVPLGNGSWHGNVLGELRKFGFPNRIEPLRAYIAGADEHAE